MFGTRFGMRWTSYVVAVALVVITAAPALGEPPGAESPEALVERAKRAAEASDMRELLACVSPEGRLEMAKMMYAMATMMVGFAMMGAEMGSEMGAAMAESMGEEVTAEQRAETEAAKQAALAEVGALLESYNAMAAKHGLPQLSDFDEPPDEDVDEFFRNIDSIALIADVTAFLESVSGDDGSGMTGDEAALDTAAGVMTDLVIEDDSATATIDGQEVKFVRIEGRWYFDAQGSNPFAPSGF
jgi:hypothetical protein